jgi:hypothetical protein
MLALRNLGPLSYHLGKSSQGESLEMEKKRWNFHVITLHLYYNTTELHPQPSFDDIC